MKIIESDVQDAAGKSLNPPHHTRCTQCGGYLQGTREVVGTCLNCADGRGWVVQQAPDKPWFFQR